MALPLDLRDLHLTWPGAAAPLLDGLSLQVPAGSITALVGASGCGKSTLLRIAAGLLRPDRGEVAPGDAVPPGARAFVFQSPNLLPWRDIAGNVALPLELAGVARAERAARVAEALARVELSEVATALPGTLSGGMQMRASLARAWVLQPRLLLMDEPFGALDALTRGRMLLRFQALWEQGRPTVLLVTHDIDEAVLLADRVIVLAGRPLALRGTVAVDLPRPRPLALRHEAAHGALAEQVEALL